MAVGLGLHGTDWRLVVTQALTDEPGAAQRRLQDIGLPSYAEALHSLVNDPQFIEVLARNDRDKILSFFLRLSAANPGLYSVQWVDPRWVTRFGYPEENSLSNYDFRAQRIPEDTPFVRALQGRKAAAFEQPLFEGGIGIFMMEPVWRGDDYLGMIYAIRVKP